MCVECEESSSVECQLMYKYIYVFAGSHHILCTLTRCYKYIIYRSRVGHAVAQWLRHCATNRKVAGSIPDGVTGIFQYGPGVDSASNRNDYHENFLGAKAAGA
jgi:hypothetical protein